MSSSMSIHAAERDLLGDDSDVGYACDTVTVLSASGGTDGAHSVIRCFDTSSFYDDSRTWYRNTYERKYRTREEYVKCLIDGP